MATNEIADDIGIAFEEPLDFIRLQLNERITIKMRGERTISGILHAFDTHCNMILGEVEETHTEREFDNQSGEEIMKSNTRTIPLLFARGDSVIHISRGQQ